MKFLSLLEQIRKQVAKYFDFWSLYVIRVHPNVPSLTPHLLLHIIACKNKHVKILHRCSVLYLCTVQRVRKSHWDSRGLDWTRLVQYAPLLTQDSDWTGLDSIRSCWCVHTQRYSQTCESQDTCTETTALLMSCVWRLGWADSCLLGYPNILWKVTVSLRNLNGYLCLPKYRSYFCSVSVCWYVTYLSRCTTEFHGLIHIK